MITDTIDLSSDESSHGDYVSSSAVINHVNKYSEDSDIEPSTAVTTHYNKSPCEDPPITDKKKRGKTKGNDNKKKISTAEKQELKKRQAEERRAAKNANKIYKPGECMKHMCIEMHPVLLESWFCADVQREANASGVKIKPSSSMCDASLVLWTRNIMPTLTNNDGFVQLTPSKVKCDRGLYIFAVENVEQLVISHSLSKHIKHAAELAGCKLTLVLFGVKDYFKTSGRKTSKSQRLMTEIDLEKAITDLLVSADCDTVIVNTPNELALTIIQFTKAIAEESHKRVKRTLDEQADFYMRGENKKCVSIDKDGHGLSKLWQQMIAILPLSSLETSRAICARYKTPLELYEGLQSSDGVSELASIGVSRAAVPGAKARRVGPEFARKLHALFTEDDGSVLLD